MHRAMRSSRRGERKLRKEKKGDWLDELTILEKEEAEQITYDAPELDDEEDKKEHKKQVASEKVKPHPARDVYDEDDD